MPAECGWEALAEEVVASLSHDEKEDSVAYMETRVVPAGEVPSWAGMTQGFDEPVVIAFIDLEPAMNWTHRARYLVLRVGGGILKKVDVDRPPFMSGVSPNLRVIHQGGRAPDWAVVAAPLER